MKKQIYSDPPSFEIEAEYAQQVGAPVCGVDEVGRGPLAGPVVAAAVILDPANAPVGIRDSKKLSARRRETLAKTIREGAVAWSVAEASVEEIDRLNILQATMLAMTRAVEALDPKPQAALIDGNRSPDLMIPSRTVVKGDALSLSIAAASILAKVHRDQLMQDLAQDYPDYGWAQNAGYGVPYHLEALRLVGVTPHHRRSFAPIRQILNEE